MPAKPKMPKSPRGKKGVDAMKGTPAKGEPKLLLPQERPAPPAQEVPDSTSSLSPRILSGESPRSAMPSSSSSTDRTGPRTHSPRLASTTPPKLPTLSVSPERRSSTTRRTSEESSPSLSSTREETESRRERSDPSPSQ